MARCMTPMTVDSGGCPSEVSCGAPDVVPHEPQGSGDTLSDFSFGGRYVPEALYEALGEVKTAFQQCLYDESFWTEFKTYYTAFRGHTRLQFSSSLTESGHGAQVFLKREDLKYTGSHAVTNALGQALLARRMGRTQVITETGSGSHGVATAAVCQLLGLKCIVYMGSCDVERRPWQKWRMEDLGATVIEVWSGAGTLREATNDALRALVSTERNAYHLCGGPNGPDPYPSIVSEFQALAGRETREAVQALTGQLPRAVVACAGAHGPAVGMFLPFIRDPHVMLIAVEGEGPGIGTGQHAAVLSQGTPGVFRGAHTLLLQDETGQLRAASSVAGDFGDPVASPQLAEWTWEHRIKVVTVTDLEAAYSRSLLSLLENIKCSWEDGHAVFAALSEARHMGPDDVVVVCIGGGDGDSTDAFFRHDLL